MALLTLPEESAMLLPWQTGELLLAVAFGAAKMVTFVGTDIPGQAPVETITV